MTSIVVDRGPWTDAAFPRPSDAEVARRWVALRGLAQEAGARAIVVAGHGGGTAEIQHLANVAVRWESLLVASVDADVPPLLLLQLDNHAAGAADWTTVPIEVAGPDLAGAAVSWLRGRLGPGDPIGSLGPISERTGHALREALPDRPVIALGPAFQRHRLVKRDEELDWVAWAATACDEAIAGFRADARPGMTEQELTALLASRVATAGAQPGICFLATAPASGGQAVVPRQVPGRRRTGSGDMVLFELSAGMCGVTTQILRTIVLDGVAEPRVRQLHDVADAAFATLLEAVRPGVTPARLEALGGAIIERTGMTIVDDLVHGYGGGYLPPVLRTPGTRRSPPADSPLEEGMLLVLQPNVVSADRRHGVQTGELVAVTGDGVRTFHQTARGLLAAPMH